MNPPRLATWLLFTLCTGPDVQAIEGDLREQYSNRSAFWYWRQVIYAVILDMLRDLKCHWVLALRAIWIGGVVMGVADLLSHRVAYWLLGPILGAPVSPSSLPVILLVMGVPSVAGGWVVGRLHRPHGVPFAIAFAIVVIPIQLLPRLVFLTRNSFQHERFLPYLWGYMAAMPFAAGVVVTGILLGTFLAQPAREELREGPNAKL